MTYGLEDSEKWNSAALLFDKNPLDSVRKSRIEAHITNPSKMRPHKEAFNSTISFHNLQNFREMQKDPTAEKSNIDTFQAYQDKRVPYSSNTPESCGTDPVSIKDQFSRNLQDGQALFNHFLNTSKIDNSQNASTTQISNSISMESIQYKTLSLKVLRMIASITVVICLFIIKLLTLTVSFLKRKTEIHFLQPPASDDLQKENAKNVVRDDTHNRFHQDSNIKSSTPINPNSNVFKKVSASIHPRNQVQAKLLNAQFGTPSGISSPIVSDFISPNDMGTPIDHQNFEKKADASTFNWQYDAPINDASQTFSDGGYGTHFYTSKKSSNQKNTEASFLKKLFAKDTTVLDLAPTDTNADSMEIWEPPVFIKSQNRKINDMFELTQRLRASLIAEENQKKPPTQNVLLDSFLKRNELLVSTRDNWTEDNKVERLEDDYETYQAIMQEKKKREELIQLEKSSLLPLVEPLKLEYLNLVQKYWNSKDLTKKIVTGISAEVFVRDLKTLINSRWINDSVIDFYLSLVSHRSTQSTFLPSVFAFTTHFYTTFTSRGYDSVKRWAKRRKVDITKLDYVFVPINILNSHWALGVIDNKRKRFQYYDSLKGEGRTPVLNNLRSFALKEAERIYGDNVPVNFQEYLLDYDTNSPQQKNGSDCGVFTCVTVEFLSKEKALKFSQTDMPLIRQRMAYEIITGKLLD